MICLAVCIWNITICTYCNNAIHLPHDLALTQGRISKRWWLNIKCHRKKNSFTKFSREISQIYMLEKWNCFPNENEEIFAVRWFAKKIPSLLFRNYYFLIISSDVPSNYRWIFIVLGRPKKGFSLKNHQICQNFDDFLIRSHFFGSSKK